MIDTLFNHIDEFMTERRTGLSTFEYLATLTSRPPTEEQVAEFRRVRDEEANGNWMRFQ